MLLPPELRLSCDDKIWTARGLWSKKALEFSPEFRGENPGKPCSDWTIPCFAEKLQNQEHPNSKIRDFASTVEYIEYPQDFS